MIETIASGLILAAITGITVIAYKHPAGYQKIHNVLMVTIAVGILGTSIWNLAVSKTAIALSAIIASEQTDETWVIVEKLEVSFPVLLATGLGAFLYALFLLVLPQILNLKKEKGNTESS